MTPEIRFKERGVFTLVATMDGFCTMFEGEMAVKVIESSECLSAKMAKKGRRFWRKWQG